ncbi:cupin [Leptolyngbya ohadii]|uniref:cysteine dioxygenase family protein n=1 Tax=Leptolyngbya ohadii TaxID=1962290 RepID=UPI000B59947F|nr:cupin [Leptolyngbya ohadii]
MKNRDFLVTGDGSWRVCKPPKAWDLLRTPYHFHRFLTEVEDALNEDHDEIDRLAILRAIVRRLITNSYWLQTQKPELAETGIPAKMLYDEIGYPLTAQTAIAKPGIVSTIHNHGNWGIVAILEGEESNTIWRRVPDAKFPQRVEAVGEIILLPGDIISFTGDAIHSVKAIGDEPTFSFSLYGETYHSRRFEYDPIAHTAKNF